MLEVDLEPAIRTAIELVAVLGPAEIAELDEIGGPGTSAAALEAIATGHVAWSSDGTTLGPATPVAGEAVRVLLRRDRPEELDRLLTLQADLRLRTGRGDAGLTAARTLGDLPRLARIIDRWGVDLAHGPHAALMSEITAQLPVELARDLPGLAYRFEDTGRLPVGTTPIELPRTRQEAEAEFTRTGDLRLRQLLLPLVTRRRQGRFGEAMAIVRAALPLAEASVYPLYDERNRILPYWYLQCGVTAQAAGDLHTAWRYFLNAWTHRARDPYGFVARGTAGKLALMDALRGELVAASRWLTEAQQADGRPDLWTDPFVESNLTAVAAIQAADRLDPQAGSRVSATPHPTQRNEQWPVFLWIQVHHALGRHDTAQAQRFLDDTLAAPRTAQQPAGPAGLAGGLVPLVRAEIHLARGRANQALAELAEAPDIAGTARVLRARTLLLSGQPEPALHVAEDVVHDGRACPRSVTEAHLVLAAAHHATGARAAAVGAARRATARVQEQEALRALATVPRTVLDDLADDVPGLAAQLAELDARGVVDIYPASVALITVTKRERDLLSDLSSGLSLTAIAKANFVSINTTRTHLANLRRKLDARSRDEVVVRARQLGLLTQAPHG